MSGRVLVIACGAIARELVRIRELNGWDHIEFQCLPAELHNRPDKIPDRVKQKIEQESENFEHIFVGYADCGTGGMLDKVLNDFDIDRIPGAHCYEFFSGSEAFSELSDQEAGTFYLTDFLVQHFDRLVVEGLGLDRFPELMPQYFGNYKRLTYLAQTRSEKLEQRAREHAQYLGLDYHYHFSGDEPLTLALKDPLKHAKTDRHLLA